jgi:hypothetical protein
MLSRDKFEESTAWDRRHLLPVCSSYNNPWIYMAYASKIMFDYDKCQLKYTDVLLFAQKCQISSGLYNRWPDGSGGVTSHDELMGIAYLDRKRAKEIFFYLVENDGIYINVDYQFDSKDRFNLFRFPWFISYLKARALIPLSVWSQFLWCLPIIQDLLFYNSKKKKDEDGRLMKWLMSEEMIRFPLCKFFFSLWVTKMMKLKQTPREQFRTYLKDYPVFFELAPDYYKIPT